MDYCDWSSDVCSFDLALDGVEQQPRGPHGRPVLLRLPLGEIARRFGR